MSRRALLVGIDKYDGDPLAFCVADAQAIRAVLESPEYGFNCRLLENEQATTRNIKNELEVTLREGTESALFYFAGHGVSNDVGAYLLTADSTERDDDGLDLKQLLGMIRGYTESTAAVVVLLDCCQAGAASIGHGRVRVALAADDFSDYLAFFSSRRALIAACQENQAADEIPDLKHGIFTHFLLEGLLGDAVDQYGTVTINSLYDSVARAFMANHAQTPVFQSEMAGHIELGAGLLSKAAKREVDALESLELRAESHLNTLQAHLVKAIGNQGEWKTSGYRTACKAVAPIMEWFEHQSLQNPGLRERSRFSLARASLLAKTKILGTLEPGIRIDEGVIDCTCRADHVIDV